MSGPPRDGFAESMSSALLLPLLLNTPSTYHHKSDLSDDYNIMDNRRPTPNQLSTALPGPTVYLTGHDETSGKAIIHSKRPIGWVSYDEDKLSMAVAYTTSFPADLNQDADIKKHEEKMASGKLGLVSGGGTVLRYVDFAPLYECMMHRTQSVDYGIVLEGQIESVLDSGETQIMGRGDVMVQRATMVSATKRN